MPGLDPGRQFGAELAIIEALVHMRQHRALRPQPLDPAEHLPEIGMRRVRLAAQAIDDPQFDAGERVERRVVEIDDIGRIADRADAETERLAETVALPERHDRDARNAERPVDGLRRERPPAHGPPRTDLAESKAAEPPELLQRRGPRIEW